MEYQSTNRPSFQTRAAAYRIVARRETQLPVPERQVVEEMERSGYDREEARGALQYLVAEEVIALTEDGIRPDR